MNTTRSSFFSAKCPGSSPAMMRVNSDGMARR
jgi:hypothetical protein